MVNAHIPSSEAPKRHKKKTFPWVLAVSLATLGALGASVGYWMYHNGRLAFTASSEIAATLHRDQNLGVPPSQLTPLSQKLSRIQHSYIALIPARFWGGMGGVPQALQALKTASAHLLAHDMQYERHTAIQWGERLVSAEGRFAALTPSQVSQKVSQSSHLSQLNAQVQTWKSQYIAWQNTLHHLAFIGGGLNHDQPLHVLQAVRSINVRLASQGPYWQGVNMAKSAISRSQTYLHSRPSEELAQYPHMMATLTQALQGLKPPTQTQLLQILGQISNGLENNQPSDVLDALSSLKAKLAGANSQWIGYNQAQSIVGHATAYLQSPIMKQINQHQQMITQLNGAIEGLQAAAPATPNALGNPFGQAFRQYLATRQTVLSAAVYNANTGVTYTFNSGLNFDTASIVKTTIMATLLWKAQNSGQPLTPQEQSLMIPMIEDSSNSAATALWNDAGHSAGIGTFLQAAGMTETIAGKGGYWGLTQTTALNQVSLLKLLSYPNSILSPVSQSYALNLMEHVIGWEAWGVSSGATAGTTVALKNGWLPIGSAGWEINSIGRITGNGRNYVVAILSHNNPTEAYGIQTVNQVSQFIWNTQ